MGLVLLLDTAQDRDRVFDTGLADEDLLEATFERRILFDVLAVLIQGRRADHPQLTTGQHRLQHVAGIHGRVATGPRSHDGVELIDEGDDLSV